MALAPQDLGMPGTLARNLSTLGPHGTHMDLGYQFLGTTRAIHEVEGSASLPPAPSSSLRDRPAAILPAKSAPETGGGAVGNGR